MRNSWLVLIATVLIGFSLVWLLVTYLPVLIVETKYQVYTFITTQFHVQDLRSFFIPDFRNFDLSANSTHREYGITIPKLGIDEPVVFNVDPNNESAYRAALKEGIAHASGTAFPDNPGLGYYFAHSSNPDFRTQYNAIFYLLGKLNTGDKVYIWHDNQRYDYQVTSQAITSPTDVSFLQKSYDTESIVLQTCWPPGTTNQRMLVFAERVK